MLEVRKRHISNLLILLIAALWATVLAGLIFNLIMGESTSDIHNYIRDFDRFSTHPRYRDSNPFMFFINETAFHYSYEKLSVLVLSPELALRIITFLTALLMLFSASNSSLFRFAWVFAILSHPRVVDLLVSQQRSAISVLLFCLGIRSKSLSMRTLFFVLAVAVHMSALVMVAGYVMYQVAQKWFYFRKVLIFLGFLLLVFVTTILQELILQLLGSHRGGTSAGFLYTVMMLGLFSYVFFSGPRLSHSVFLFFAVVMIASSGMAFILDQYSSRFMAFALVFLAFSNYDPKPMAKVMFTYLYIASLLVSYYFWML